jgi:hypothetical protein
MMKFIRATHVPAFGGRNVTFGIDPDGNVWIATNTGKPDEEPEYFGFSVHTFSELVHSLFSLAFAALRFRLTGSMYFTEAEPQEKTIPVSASAHEYAKRTRELTEGENQS